MASGAWFKQEVRRRKTVDVFIRNNDLYLKRAVSKYKQTSVSWAPVTWVNEGVSHLPHVLHVWPPARCPICVQCLIWTARAGSFLLFKYLNKKTWLFFCSATHTHTHTRYETTFCYLLWPNTFNIKLSIASKMSTCSSSRRILRHKRQVETSASFRPTWIFCLYVQCYLLLSAEVLHSLPFILWAAMTIWRHFLDSDSRRRSRLPESEFRFWGLFLFPVSRGGI